VTDPLPAGTDLSISAVMAQSRVAIELPARAKIAPVPKTTLSSQHIQPGGTVTVTVEASLVTDSYALYQEDGSTDQPIGAAQTGNGATLSLGSGPLTRTTVLVLAAISTDPIRVRRRARWSVVVGPAPLPPASP
jgi:hypothetical protein